MNRNEIRAKMEGTAVNCQFIEELYKDYFEELHRYCAMQFHFAPEYMPTVDDIVQEVFIKAYRNQHMLMKHANKMGWLCITCRNMCKSIIRRNLRRREITGVAVPLEECNEYSQHFDDIMRWVEQLEDQEALKSLKQTLTPTELGVYEAYYEDGRSDHEVAEKMGMTLVAVRGVLQRIRNKAKKHEFLIILCLTHPIVDILRTVIYEGRH